MNDELKKKLAEDLKKTGFGSELRAVAELNKLGWNCTASSGYFDKDENKTREIDVSAYHLKKYELPTGEAMRLFFYLIIEVKKSDTPWIVFRHDLNEWDRGCGWDNIISCVNLPNDPSTLFQAISKNSLKTVVSWSGSGIHHAFKDPNMPSRWYSAFTTACKAAEHEFELNKHISSDGGDRSITKDFNKSPTSLSFFQPLVILDGPLFSASIDQKGEIDLQEIKAAPFNFKFQTSAYTRRHYRIDLITADFLTDYSELAKSRINDIHDAILKMVSG